ncbi:MAG: hypothetical protein ABIX28_20220 [Vicinamibacterales bacterium]
MTNSAERRELSSAMLAEEFDELFGGANPNPDRIGCPTRQVLSLLSRRELPIDHPGYDHLAECSPCYLEFREFQKGHNSSANVLPARRTNWIAAIAAGLLLAVAGTWLYSGTAHRQEPSREIIVAEHRVELDLRRFTVSRSAQEQGAQAPVDLPRERVTLTMLLPAGSEPGGYDVQLLDAQSHAQASAPGRAEIRNFVTTLEAAMDLRSAATGLYQLALRREGEDWRLFPASVK